MRLLAPHNYRAYPELDRFSDEQCGDFVRAANRSWRARLWRWPLLGVMVAGAVMVSVSLTWLVVKFGETHRIPGGSLLVFLVTAAVAIGSLVAGMVLAMVVRDWLLGRRVRRVLRKCGTCAKCGYVLFGIRVGEDLRVSCPECGEVVEVDPSLNELARGAGGVREYRPQVPREHRAQAERRRRRHRRGIKIVALVTAIVTIVPGTVYGVWWRALVRQARVAALARDGHQKLAELSRSMQPAGYQSDADSDAYRSLMQEFCGVMKSVRDGWLRDPAHVETMVDFLIFAHAGTPEEYERANQVPGGYARTLEVTQRALDELKARGTIDRLRKLPGYRALGLKEDLPQEEPLMNLWVSELGTARTIMRLCLGRMHMAMYAGDREVYLEALSEGLSVARATDNPGLGICWLVSTSIEEKLLDAIETHLVLYPDVTWVKSVSELVKSRFDRGSIAGVIQAERLIALDTVRWFYSDPARVRLGSLTGKFGEDYSLGNSPGPQWIASYADTEADVNGFFDALEAPLALPAAVRGLPQIRLPKTSIGRLLAPSFARMFGSEPALNGRRRRLMLRMAMEMQRLETGRYPATIDEVCEDLSAEQLMDLWNRERMIVTFVSDDTVPGGQRPVLSTPTVENGPSAVVQSGK